MKHLKYIIFLLIPSQLLANDPDGMANALTYSFYVSLILALLVFINMKRKPNSKTSKTIFKSILALIVFFIIGSIIGLTVVM